MIYRYQLLDHVYEIQLERQGDHYLATVDGETFQLEILNDSPGQLSLRFQGKPVRLYWAEDHGQKWISFDGCTYLLEKPTPKTNQLDQMKQKSGLTRAPMPAQVQAIPIHSGDIVHAGETLMLLEAMKMEIRITAPIAGKVFRIHVEEGQFVRRDELLVELEG
jgi:biotin carboxyl carrier protein